jgi:hypothetical protein
VDHQLEVNARVTSDIDAQVRDSAILLVVLSPGFLDSPWCERELKQFLSREACRRKGPGSRVFLVECDKVEVADRPPALANLNASRFWDVYPENKVPYLDFS